MEHLLLLCLQIFYLSAHSLFLVDLVLFLQVLGIEVTLVSPEKRLSITFVGERKGCLPAVFGGVIVLVLVVGCESGVELEGDE